MKALAAALLIGVGSFSELAGCGGSQIVGPLA